MSSSSPSSYFTNQQSTSLRESFSGDLTTFLRTVPVNHVAFPLIINCLATPCPTNGSVSERAGGDAAAMRIPDVSTAAERMRTTPRGGRNMRCRCRRNGLWCARNSVVGVSTFRAKKLFWRGTRAKATGTRCVDGVDGWRADQARVAAPPPPPAQAAGSQEGNPQFCSCAMAEEDK